MMARTQWRRFGAVLGAGMLIAACDKVDEAINAAESGVIVQGVVKDTYGNPVEGAEVLVYTYSQNYQKFGRPDENPDVTDPATAKIKVDLGELLANGEPEAKKGVTAADGTYKIEGLGVDGLILVARKQSYAVDIAGMDAEDGTISQSSILIPDSASQEELTLTVDQNFILAGGPPPFADDGDNAISDDVTPVVPPAPPTAPPAPEPEPPPPPECLANNDCMPGNVCKAGACGPECTEATVEADCGPAKACREGACGPQCLGHSDCADGEICDAASLTCAPQECDADDDCGAAGHCTGNDAGSSHGRCAPGCTDGGGECEATNQICDLNPAVNGCRFECLANTDCGGDTPLCANNHCVAAECDSHDACLGEGKNGGYCQDFACVKECEADDACADRNMVCDTTAFRCKLECEADAACEGHANGPLCNDFRCGAAECDLADAGAAACLAEGMNGGLCAGAGRCVEQCTVETAAEACGDANAECPRARCIMPDPNELHPPTTTPWTQFLVQDAGGTTIVDASTMSGVISPEDNLVKNGGIVRLVATVDGAPAGDSVAFLRVQIGDSHCSPVSYAPISVEFPVLIRDGKLVSDKGDYQEWVVADAYQQLQLDLDQELSSGNESHLVTISTRCNNEPGPNVTPSSSLTVTLGWDKDKVDADLHVWNQDGVETFYGSREGGERRRSSYGRIDVDDRNGFGPEVFTLNPDVTNGTYTIRARYFAGPVATAEAGFYVRVVRKLGDGNFSDETFTFTAKRRSGAESGWVDIGVFGVGEVAAPIGEEPTEEPAPEEPAPEEPTE